MKHKEKVLGAIVLLLGFVCLVLQGQPSKDKTTSREFSVAFSATDPERYGIYNKEWQQVDNMVNYYKTQMIAVKQENHGEYLYYWLKDKKGKNIGYVNALGLQALRRDISVEYQEMKKKVFIQGTIINSIVFYEDLSLNYPRIVGNLKESQEQFYEVKERAVRDGAAYYLIYANEKRLGYAPARHFATLRETRENEKFAYINFYVLNRRVIGDISSEKLLEEKERVEEILNPYQENMQFILNKVREDGEEIESSLQSAKDFYYFRETPMFYFQDLEKELQWKNALTYDQYHFYTYPYSSEVLRKYENSIRHKIILSSQKEADDLAQMLKTLTIQRQNLMVSSKNLAVLRYFHQKMPEYSTSYTLVSMKELEDKYTQEEITRSIYEIVLPEDQFQWEKLNQLRQKGLKITIQMNDLGKKEYKKRLQRVNSMMPDGVIVLPKYDTVNEKVLMDYDRKEW